jgi:CheY-like chemotaxis protein
VVDSPVAATLSRPVMRRDLADALTRAMPAHAPLEGGDGSAQPTSLADGIAPRRMRVLLAEDNKTNQFVFSSMVKAMEIELEIVGNGAEAVRSFRQRQPDLIFTDISMPLMDGKEAARRIRAIEAESGLPRTPIVAITAHAMEHDAQEILATGVDYYLTKPLKKASLEEYILAACPEAALPPFPSDTDDTGGTDATRGGGLSRPADDAVGPAGRGSIDRGEPDDTGGHAPGRADEVCGTDVAGAGETFAVAGPDAGPVTQEPRVEAPRSDTVADRDGFPPRGDGAPASAALSDPQDEAPARSDAGSKMPGHRDTAEGAVPDTPFFTRRAAPAMGTSRPDAHTRHLVQPAFLPQVDPASDRTGVRLPAEALPVAE